VSEVAAAKSKSKKKARVRTKTKGKQGSKKAQVKPSSPEGHMSTRNTDYEVVVTCNGTYVKVFEGVVRVDRNAPYRTVDVRAGGRLFIPKGH
jgi:hypothetical protein